jgi:hypothetical protein
MANASKKHMGIGAQGKGSGEGAMTTMPKDMVPDNAVLSNRDKTQHSKERGHDSRGSMTDQYQDHSGNRYPEE